MVVVTAFLRGLPRGLDPGLTGADPLAFDAADLASDSIERSAAAGLILSTCPHLVQVWFMAVSFKVSRFSESRGPLACFSQRNRGFSRR